MSAQVAADLRAAAEVLRRDGWTQAAYHRTQPRGACSHCVVGSVEVAVGRWRDGHYTYVDDDGRMITAWAMLMRHLGQSDANAVIDWNDARGRTADEVIAALEAAADAAEASNA